VGFTSNFVTYEHFVDALTRFKKMMEMFKKILFVLQRKVCFSVFFSQNFVILRDIISISLKIMTYMEELEYGYDSSVCKDI
jgi:hypothetical protein